MMSSSTCQEALWQRSFSGNLSSNHSSSLSDSNSINGISSSSTTVGVSLIILRLPRTIERKTGTSSSCSIMLSPNGTVLLSSSTKGVDEALTGTTGSKTRKSWCNSKSLSQSEIDSPPSLLCLLVC